jgi:hypothetical protein
MKVRIYQPDYHQVFDEAGQPKSAEALGAYRDIRSGKLTLHNSLYYTLVWEGYLTPEQRKNIFREFNRVAEVPAGVLEILDFMAILSGFDGYRMASLSVGDLIADVDAEDNVTKVEIVESFGFGNVTTAYRSYVSRITHGPIENRYWKRGA